MNWMRVAVMVTLFSSLAWAGTPSKIELGEAVKHLASEWPAIRGVDGAPGGVPLLRVSIVVGKDGRVKSAHALDVSKYGAQAVEIVSSLQFRPFRRHLHFVEAAFWIPIGFVPPEKMPTRHVEFPTITDLSSVEIWLQRGSCLGMCPIYEIHVKGDGMVTYKDEKPTFVLLGAKPLSPLLGRLQGRVSPTEVGELVNAFRRADFFSLDDVYKVDLNDLAAYRVNIRIGSEEKTVIDYSGEAVGMPHAVTLLERKIDEVFAPIRAAALKNRK